MIINTTSVKATIIFSLIFSIPAIVLYMEGFENTSYAFFSLTALIIGTFSGKEFNVKQKKYRNYISIFGLKNGKWKDYSEYIGIVIFSGKGTKESLGANIAITHSRRTEIHTVFLVNKEHRKKMKLSSKRNRKRVERLASLVSKNLDIPIVKYNPIISEQTLARRRKSS